MSLIKLKTASTKSYNFRNNGTMTVYTTSKMRFIAYPSTNIQWLHSLKLINHDSIHLKITEAVISYLQFGLPPWLCNYTTVHVSYNFRLRYQSNPHNCIGNNIPVHQSKQLTECNSFGYTNDTGDDTYNQTMRSQHHWESQQHSTMPFGGMNFNHLPPKLTLYKYYQLHYRLWIS